MIDSMVPTAAERVANLTQTPTAAMPEAAAILHRDIEAATYDLDIATRHIEQAHADLADATQRKDRAQRTIDQLTRIKAIADGD
jgi:hypothetical protein